MTKPLVLSKRKTINEDSPTYIIAEIGLNHNGDFNLAKKMILAAKECNVDAVKFQTFNTDKFLSNEFSQEDRDERKKHELSRNNLIDLKKLSDSLNLDFFSTPLDAESANILDDIGCDLFKIASCDINNIPLLRHVASKNKPMIISTGFSNLSEVQQAIREIEKINPNLAILHCVSVYPTPINLLNLRAIKTLRDAFPYFVGFSDHTFDTTIPATLSVGLGSKIYEVHFTLDRSTPGYDHKISADPKHLTNLVTAIRSAEHALGSAQKEPNNLELERRTKARRSLFWNSDLGPNCIVTENDLITLRPGNGICPTQKDSIIGATITKDVKKGKQVEPQDYKK